MPIPNEGHPAKCPKCDSELIANFSVFRDRKVNPDGTLGDWLGGDTYEIYGYSCQGCGLDLDTDGEIVEEE